MKPILNQGSGRFKSYKGYYTPTYPSKYKGDPTNIVYRSLLERRYMQWFDSSSSILEWSSEETVIPYRSMVDGRMHRYFVDFKIRVQNKDGEVHTWLIEVKPDKFTRAPVIKRKTRGALLEMKDYMVNYSKWEAAKKYCDERGWKFHIFTEKNVPS